MKRGVLFFVLWLLTLVFLGANVSSNVIGIVSTPQGSVALIIFIFLTFILQVAFPLAISSFAFLSLMPLLTTFVCLLVVFCMIIVVNEWSCIPFFTQAWYPIKKILAILYGVNGVFASSISLGEEKGHKYFVYKEKKGIINKFAKLIGLNQKPDFLVTQKGEIIYEK